MKHLVLSVLFIIGIQQLIAQKGLPAFGKIDKSDLEMKDCDFDKGADAFTLIDRGNVYYDRGTSGITLFKTVFERRVRIKILKEKGLSYANVTIPYYSHNNDEKMLKIDAYTYNIDETGNIKTTDVGKGSIYTKRINPNHSDLIIAFPEVKVGSVIEYRYRMERETWTDIKDWYFQGSIPVRYSEYEIKIPKICVFTEKHHVVEQMDTKDEVFEDVISVNNSAYNIQTLKKTYTMHNLVGIRDEPYMGAAEDYMQRLEFQLSQLDWGNGDVVDLRTKWSDVIHNELVSVDYFGKQLEAEVPQAAGIVLQAQGLPDAESKIKLIYNYVRRNLSWDGGESIYSFDGVNNALEKKNGNSGDINLLLINLLKKAGVKVSPILFSTRENGLVSTFYNSVRQFNVVMAYAQGNDKPYVLDATDKISGYKLIPASVVNTRGFLVEGENGKWLDIIENKNKYKVMTALHGVIDAAGVMKGDGMVNCSGYAKKERCKTWILDKEKFRKKYFGENNAVTIEDLTVNNVETDSLPLEQKIKFSTPLSSSGDYRYFTVNLFSDLEKNPFIADERQTDVDFGFQQEYLLFGNYTIPEGYIFDALPEDISMLMPDNSIVFNRFLKAEDNLLNVRITVEFKSSFYPAANYPEFKEFYKKLLAKLNEQIVIKKKTAP